MMSLTPQGVWRRRGEVIWIYGFAGDSLRGCGEILSLLIIELNWLLSLVAVESSSSVLLCVAGMGCRWRRHCLGSGLGRHVVWGVGGVSVLAIETTTPVVVGQPSMASKAIGGKKVDLALLVTGDGRVGIAR